jgi:ABC-type molybdate transport system substrate-binding protein
MLWPACLLSLFFVVGTAPPVRVETVTIAAASDLTYCIEELNRSYQESHPDTELKLSTGSSGNFSTQIQNRALFDVFLSADIQYPKTSDKRRLGFATRAFSARRLFVSIPRAAP